MQFRYSTSRYFAFLHFAFLILVLKLSLGDDSLTSSHSASLIYNYVWYVVGVVSTIAGGGGSTAGGYADGQGVSALFNNPFAMAVNSQGVIYVGDFWNNLIRRISSSG